MDLTTPRLTVPVSERDHSKGPLEAKAVIVEYGDYECPHCRLVHHDIKAVQKHLDERICYVFRHLPISTVHPQAQLAAEAAEAAAAQGKFWEMHNALFENDDLSRRNILHLAEEIGLDLERFREELDNHIYADRVAEDFESGIRSGVNRTPTFFVNGRRYDGAWDLESLLETLQKPLGARIKLLSQEFAQITAAGGIVLLFFTILALIFANSSFESTYTSILETQVTLFEFGGSDIVHLSETLLHWVNDGLMVIFFFVVGLEIKREIQTGELANPRRAALPVAGALGGMIFPALLYFLFNRSGPDSAGWGSPMATDIAFSLGGLSV
jgi:NhaA family Na+:H+ antiporter